MEKEVSHARSLSRDSEAEEHDDCVQTESNRSTPPPPDSTEQVGECLYISDPHPINMPPPSLQTAIKRQHRYSVLSINANWSRLVAWMRKSRRSRLLMNDTHHTESTLPEVSDEEALLGQDQQTQSRTGAGGKAMWLRKRIYQFYKAVVNSIKDLIMFMR